MICTSEAQTGTSAGPTVAQRLAALPPRKTLAYGKGRLSYRETGSGPMIVFLHGLLGCADSWVWQMQDLADRYRVIAWDAPGYGSSDIVEPTLDAFADALQALLRHLGAENFALVGHSMGGVVSTFAAARHSTKITRLVLSCTHAGYAQDQKSPPSPKLLQRIRDLETLGADVYGRMRAQGMVAPSASAAVLELAAKIAAQTQPTGVFNATRALQFADARPLYEKLNVPTLVLFGAQDPVVRPELSAELRRLTPFARHIDLAGVGHAPYLENPELYTRTIRTFIETES